MSSTRRKGLVRACFLSAMGLALLGTIAVTETAVADSLELVPPEMDEEEDFEGGPGFCCLRAKGCVELKDGDSCVADDKPTSASSASSASSETFASPGFVDRSLLQAFSRDRQRAAAAGLPDLKGVLTECHQSEHENVVSFSVWECSLAQAEGAEIEVFVREVASADGYYLQPPEGGVVVAGFAQGTALGKPLLRAARVVGVQTGGEQ